MDLATLTTTAAIPDCPPCEVLAAAATAAPAPAPAAPVSPQNRAPWAGVLVVEGLATGDGRLIEPGALAWENLPLPLRYVPVDTGAHDGAMVVGMISHLERVDGGNIEGRGWFDLDAEFGPEAHRQVQLQQQDGVSVDLDDVAFEVRVSAEVLDAVDAEMEAMLGDDEPAPREVGPDGRVVVVSVSPDDELMVTTSARIRAATLVAIPAFDTARIYLVDPGDAPADDDPMDDPADRPEDQPEDAPADDDEMARRRREECATGDALAAGAAPDAPPAAWFAAPALAGPTPLTVTDDGRVYGHLATWGTCHISHTHSGCVTPPHSAAGYAHFTTGALLTAEGSEVAVGHITLDTTHAGTTLSAAAAAAHYENTGRVVADVAAGEDSHGIWVAGALRPTVTPAQIRALRASPLSGDWRRLSGNLELVAALAVVVPGFPIPRPAGLVAGGVARSLVASGLVPPRVIARPVADVVAGLSGDDVRYLKRLAARERADARAAGSLPPAAALARRVRASALSLRAHRAGARDAR